MSTPINNWPELSNSANNYLLANETFRAIENAYGDLLSVSLASGNVTLTDVQFRAAVLFRATGNTVSRNLTVPAIKKLFVVQNTGTAILSVVRGSASLQGQPSSASVFYTDGTTNNLVAIAGGGSGGGGLTASASSSSGVLSLSAVTVDSVLVTLTENITSITLPAGTAGVRKDLVIRFKQDATGGRTVDLTAIQWEGGTPPAIASGADQVTYITASNLDNQGWEGFK